MNGREIHVLNHSQPQNLVQIHSHLADIIVVYGSARYYT